jgi:branched-chain amino acid transport system permease protein
MDSILPQILNGLTLGTLLFLTASGLSVVIGLMRILTLSHGAMFLFGGFVGMSVQLASGSFLLAIAAGIVSAAALGWLVQRLFLKALMGSAFRQVLLTLGIAFVVSDAILWIWGGIPRAIQPPEILAGSVQLGSTTYPTYRLFLIGFGLLAGVALWLLWERSLWGAKLRACVDDRPIAATQGINVGFVFSAVFVIGAALAGMAGVLGGVVLGVSIGLDFDMQLLALVVVIIGGLGSLNGAFVGSMVVGLLDSFSKASFPSLSYFTIFAPVVIMLIVRPQGLFGKKGLE